MGQAASISLRRKNVLLPAVLLLLTPLVAFLLLSPQHSALSSFDWPSYSPSFTKWRQSSSLSSLATPALDRHQTIESLISLYEDERLSLLLDYDQEATERLVNSPRGALNAHFDDYISRLSDFVESHFNQSTHQYPLERMLDGLSSAVPPPLVKAWPFEKVVYTWDKEGEDGVPPEFEYWEKRLGPDGWEIYVGDDADVERWFGESTSVTVGLEEPGTGSGAGRWWELWDGLGRPVLKSDLLRYLMMLTRGGLYTDSDTSVLSNPLKWGNHATRLTPPALRALQRAMLTIDPTPLQPFANAEEDSSGGGALFRGGPEGSDEEPSMSGEPEMLDMYSSRHLGETGMLDPRVSMIISVEYDVTHPRQDPREGYTRDLQMVQWTFMAKPYHPIFLDVLETASTRIMQSRLDSEGQDSWRDVLDSTGPGPFTDAVLRYLLVQYAITPQALIGMEDGVLAGDVLILPLHAFGSYLGGEEDWEAHDPSTRCTAHGFRGRWKGDMNFDKRARRYAEAVMPGR